MFHKMLQLRKKLYRFFVSTFSNSSQFNTSFYPPALSQFMPPSTQYTNTHQFTIPPPTIYPPPLQFTLPLERGDKKAWGGEGMTSLTPLPGLFNPTPFGLFTSPPPPPDLFKPHLPPGLLPHPPSLYPQFTLPLWGWGGGGGVDKKLEGARDEVETWLLVKNRA